MKRNNNNQPPNSNQLEEYNKKKQAEWEKQRAEKQAKQKAFFNEFTEIKNQLTKLLEKKYFFDHFSDDQYKTNTFPNFALKVNALITKAKTLQNYDLDLKALENCAKNLDEIFSNNEYFYANDIYKNYVKSILKYLDNFENHFCNVCDLELPTVEQNQDSKSTIVEQQNNNAITTNTQPANENDNFQPNAMPINNSNTNFNTIAKDNLISILSFLNRNEWKNTKQAAKALNKAAKDPTLTQKFPFDISNITKKEIFKYSQEQELPCLYAVKSKNLIVGISPRRKLCTWDIKEKRTLFVSGRNENYGSYPNILAISTDENYAAIGYKDECCKVDIYDLANKKFLYTITENSLHIEAIDITAIKFISDNDLLIVTNSDSFYYDIIRKKAFIQTVCSFSSINLSGDQTVIFSGGNNYIETYDFSAKYSPSLILQSAIYTNKLLSTNFALLSIDKNFIICASSKLKENKIRQQNVIIIYNLKTKKIVKEISTTSEIIALNMSRDGRFVITTETNKTDYYIGVYDLTSRNNPCCAIMNFKNKLSNGFFSLENDGIIITGQNGIYIINFKPYDALDNIESFYTDDSFDDSLYSCTPAEDFFAFDDSDSEDFTVNNQNLTADQDNDSPENTNIAHLPSEILLNIFSLLGRKDLQAVGGTCNSFYDLSNKKYLLKPYSNKFTLYGVKPIRAIATTKNGEATVVNTDEVIIVWDSLKKRRIAIINQQPNTQYIYCTVAENKKIIASYSQKKINETTEYSFQILSLTGNKISEITAESLKKEVSCDKYLILNVGFIAYDNYLAILIKPIGPDKNNIYFLVFDILNGFLLQKDSFNPSNLALISKQEKELFSKKIKIFSSQEDLSQLGTQFINIKLPENSSPALIQITNIHIFSNKKYMLCTEYIGWRVLIVELETNNVTKEIKDKNNPLYAVSLSLSERYVAISTSREIKIYDLNLLDNPCIKTICEPNIDYLAFSQLGLQTGGLTGINLIEFSELGIDPVSEGLLEMDDSWVNHFSR